MYLKLLWKRWGQQAAKPSLPPKLEESDECIILTISYSLIQLQRERKRQLCCVQSNLSFTFGCNHIHEYFAFVISDVLAASEVKMGATGSKAIFAPKARRI